MAVDKDFSVKNGLKVGTTISGGDTTITGFINVSSAATIGGAISACSTLTVAANLNIDSGTLFVDATNNRIGIANTSPDAELTVTGNANVSGDFKVGGDLIVSGTTTYAGTQEITGDINPVNNSYSLGNTIARWSINGNSANFSNSVTVNGNLIVSGTRSTLNSIVDISDSKITLSANVVGSTSVNASIIVNRGTTGGNVSIRWNETSDVWQFTNDGSNFNTIGTSNTVGTVTSVTVTGNSVGGITGTGTITDSGTIFISAQAANTTANGTVKLLDSVANTSIDTYAPTANAVKTAYDAAISANTRASSAQTAAATAYSNATIFAANATNITTGTISNARLNSGNTSAAGIVQLVEGVGNTSILFAATANSAKTAYDNATTAYSNAASYADTKAATAYSNAIAVAASDATSKAATAYSNAITFAANATNITTGTISNARLNSGNTSAAGIVQLVEGVGNTSILFAATANSVKTAFDNATTAYSNATTFAANATNITTGTVASARLPSGSTTASGIVQLVDSIANTSITLAATANSVKAAYDNGLNQRFANATNGFGISGTAALANSALVANNSVNLGGIAAAIYVQNTDSRTLSGNLTFTGANITFSGANLTVTSTNTYISGNVNILTSIQLGTPANAVSNGILANTTTIFVGNNTVNVTVNSTSFSGTAANATLFAGQSLGTVQGWITANSATAYSNAITYSSNATNITTGIIANARLPAANTTSAGIVQLVDSIANTSITLAAAANAVTAAVSTAASDATTKAATAYSNATTFAANATNISSGTLANARLPSAISVTSVTTSGNVTSTAGAFTGNGAGLTSVSYISTSSSAADTSIFIGGDKNTWKDGSVFYPTVASGVSTLAVGVSAGFFIKQVADVVTSNNDVTAGPGNPQLLYRIVKVPSVGGNTVLYTSSNNTLSTPGSGGGFLINAVDTTPTSGNSTGYAIQYLWQDVSADPNANAGTITTSNDTTVTVTGTGTYFTATINSRLQIAAANATTNTTPYVNVAVVFGNGDLDLEAKLGTKVTNSSYRVRDQYANVIMDQTDILFTFVGYK